MRRRPSAAPMYTWEGPHARQFINISSYAEKMLLHENAVVKIRDDMPLDRRRSSAAA